MATNEDIVNILENNSMNYNKAAVFVTQTYPGFFNEKLLARKIERMWK